MRPGFDYFFFLVSLVLSVTAQADVIHAQMVQSCLSNPKCPYLILAAHRQGYKGKGENSLWAFKQQQTRKTDVLEMDVRRTKDGHYVLMHDEAVNRTTN